MSAILSLGPRHFSSVLLFFFYFLQSSSILLLPLSSIYLPLVFSALSILVCVSDAVSHSSFEQCSAHARLHSFLFLSCSFLFISGLVLTSLCSSSPHPILFVIFSVPSCSLLSLSLHPSVPALPPAFFPPLPPSVSLSAFCSANLNVVEWPN